MKPRVPFTHKQMQALVILGRRAEAGQVVLNDLGRRVARMLNWGGASPGNSASLETGIRKLEAEMERIERAIGGIKP